MCMCVCVCVRVRVCVCVCQASVYAFGSQYVMHTRHLKVKHSTTQGGVMAMICIVGVP